MEDDSDFGPEDLQSLDEYFDTFSNDREASKHLAILFLNRMYDLQSFMEEEGYSMEEFKVWQRMREKRTYH
jgi:hypothetical protein|tara:strand:+ start:1552 stop:1764 length:213 start_codon:yes stop_codon:yes gene_type:complete